MVRGFLGLVVSKMNNSKGYLFGLLGVAGFSMTLPATRVAVSTIDPTVVGLGRALCAAVLAAIVLKAYRQPIPPRRYWFQIAIVAAGGVVGFPVLTSYAMKHTAASHGAVLLGVLPVATACFAVLFCRERPSSLFWLSALTGSSLVISFALHNGQGGFVLPDVALLMAVVSAGMAYAIGAQLAQHIGSWQVICWALILAFPFLLPPVAYRIMQTGFHPSWHSAVGLAYVSVVSMFLAFFAWYRGLSIGGIAKVGLLQLLQPFLTIGFSHLILGEAIDELGIVVACLVAMFVFMAIRSRVRIAVAAASS